MARKEELVDEGRPVAPLLVLRSVCSPQAGTQVSRATLFPFPSFLSCVYFSAFALKVWVSKLTAGMVTCILISVKTFLLQERSFGPPGPYPLKTQLNPSNLDFNSIMTKAYTINYITHFVEKEKTLFLHLHDLFHNTVILIMDNIVK